MTGDGGKGDRESPVPEVAQPTKGGGASLPKTPVGSTLKPLASSNPVISQTWWARRLLWFRRLVTGESRLDMLAEEVTLGWQANEPQVRDLLISIEAKWQASREEARKASFLAALSFLGALCALGFGVYVLWTGHAHSASLVDEALHKALRSEPLSAPGAPERAPIVDHVLLWQALLVTSGAVLLLVGVATLLLKVADRYSHLSRQHAHDADNTRRLEAGVRIAMAFGEVRYKEGMTTQEQAVAVTTADHYNAVALKLLEEQPHHSASTPAELKTLLEEIKDLAESLGSVEKVLSKSKAGE